MMSSQMEMCRNKIEPAENEESDVNDIMQSGNFQTSLAWHYLLALNKLTVLLCSIRFRSFWQLWDLWTPSYLLFIPPYPSYISSLSVELHEGKLIRGGVLTCYFMDVSLK